MSGFSTDKYAFIKALLPKDLARYLAQYLEIQLRLGIYKRDDQCPMSFACYGDPAFEALLLYAKSRLEKVTGRKLCPTYSYTRMYVEGDVLKPHKDRPSCEVSATVCVGIPPKAPLSTIFVKRRSGQELALPMHEGDACVYLGCEIEHWRDPIPVTGYKQTFLHYVDEAGPHYPAMRFDGRVRLGMQPESKRTPD